MEILHCDTTGLICRLGPKILSLSDEHFQQILAPSMVDDLNARREVMQLLLQIDKYAGGPGDSGYCAEMWDVYISAWVKNLSYPLSPAIKFNSSKKVSSFSECFYTTEGFLTFLTCIQLMTEIF